MAKTVGCLYARIGNERLSKFQERRKKEGAGVSKRDVQNYLKKQQKEAKQETGSNAMLDALKNIKL